MAAITSAHPVRMKRATAKWHYRHSHPAHPPRSPWPGARRVRPDPPHPPRHRRRRNRLRPRLPGLNDAADRRPQRGRGRCLLTPRSPACAGPGQGAQRSCAPRRSACRGSSRAPAAPSRRAPTRPSASPSQQPSAPGANAQVPAGDRHRHHLAALRPRPSRGRCCRTAHGPWAPPSHSHHAGPLRCFIESLRAARRMVEFALILPILMFLLLGFFDLGRVVLAHDALGHAAREARPLRHRPRGTLHTAAPSPHCPAGPLPAGVTPPAATPSCPYPSPSKESIRAGGPRAGRGSRQPVTVEVCYGVGCTGDTDSWRDECCAARRSRSPSTRPLPWSAGVLIGFRSFDVSSSSTMLVNH